MTATPSTLAADITALLQSWNAREAQLRDWMAGAANGGANGDGLFPLTDASGRSYLAPSLLKLQDLIGGPAGLSVQAQLLSEAARDAALGYRNTAGDYSATALSARDTAVAAKDLALVYKNDVASAQAGVHADASQVAQDRATVTQAVPVVTAARDQTLAARDAAAGSASQAATSAATAVAYAEAIDPAQFVTTPELNTALAALVNQSPASLDTLKELADALGDDPNFATTMTNALAGKAPTIHTHAIADVAGLQAALNGKQAAGSYLVMADLTWANLANKPTTFTPSAHTHVIADVTGLQNALDGKQPVGSYQPAGSYIVTVNGTVKALDNTRNTNLWWTDEGTRNRGVIFWDRGADIMTWRRFAADGTTAQSEVQLSSAGFNVASGTIMVAGQSPNSANGLLKLDANALVPLAQLPSTVQTKNADESLEVGQYIDLHNPKADGFDYQARMQVDTVGNLFFYTRTGNLFHRGTAMFLGTSDGLLLQHDGATGFIRTNSGKGGLALGANGLNNLWMNTDGSVTCGTWMNLNLLNVTGADSTYNVGVKQSRNGQVGYHLYNSGAVAEWLLYQPAAAAGHEFRIATFVGGTKTDRFMVNPDGTVTVPGLLWGQGDIVAAGAANGSAKNKGVWVWSDKQFGMELFSGMDGNQAVWNVGIMTRYSDGGIVFGKGDKTAGNATVFSYFDNFGTFIKTNKGGYLYNTGSRLGGAVTISTAAPSGGNDGDVWYKV